MLNNKEQTSKWYFKNKGIEGSEKIEYKIG